MAGDAVCWASPNRLLTGSRAICAGTSPSRVRAGWRASPACWASAAADRQHVAALGHAAGVARVERDDVEAVAIMRVRAAAANPWSAGSPSSVLSSDHVAPPSRLSKMPAASPPASTRPCAAARPEIFDSLSPSAPWTRPSLDSSQLSQKGPGRCPSTRRCGPSTGAPRAGWHSGRRLEGGGVSGQLPHGTKRAQVQEQGTRAAYTAGAQIGLSCATWPQRDRLNDSISRWSHRGKPATVNASSPPSSTSEKAAARRTRSPSSRARAIRTSIGSAFATRYVPA